MLEISIKVKLIQDQFTAGQFGAAYNQFHLLCQSNQSYFDENTSRIAMSILSQFNELEGEFDLAFSKREERRQSLRTSFERLLIKVIRDLSPEDESLEYHDHALRMKEQRDMLRKSLMKIEDDLIECTCPQKTEILEKITKRLKNMMSYFLKLMRDLREANSYE